MGSSSPSDSPVVAVDARPSTRTMAAVVVDLAPALLVALPALAAVWEATVRASWASLGRDQGIFQYIAWAIGQGDAAYLDVRDVNGPVIAMVHGLFQSLGGADEHRFRVLDLFVNGVVFMTVGACLPSLVRARPSIAMRVSWGAAAWVALSAQYLVYGFWDTAQRESFLDWFVLLSLALQATRLSASDPKRPPTAALLVVTGALSFVAWLGKPTYALFTVAQIFALLIEPGVRAVRARRFLLFAIGGLLGLAAPLTFILRHGDLRAWARITFVDVPTMYRFIWPSPPLDILRLPGYEGVAMLAVAASLALGALVLRGRLPRRAVPIAVMPVLGLVSMLVQAKGFPYHFHPVTVGTSLGWLVGIAGLTGDRADPYATPYTARSLGVMALSLVLGARATSLARAAPDPPAPRPEARDKASLESAARLAAFYRIDFFPHALREAAEYVAAQTKPGDRVQTYGMDAYLLFLAGRRSATPYIYSYDLNADAAMHGSFSPQGPHPSREELVRIRAMRDEHERDLRARLMQRPPAAFVFFDRSPLMSSPDAVEDFTSHCPETMRWLSEEYEQAANFEGIRVWLPKVGAVSEPAR